MVKITKNDLVNIESGAMNRRWKKQEDDFGLDLAFQGSRHGEGTQIRRKGNRNDPHTDYQQAIRGAWCDCDMQYSNLSDAKKEELRHEANEFNRNHDTNWSGYHLWMSRCTQDPYQEIHEEFGDSGPDLFEPWTPESWASWTTADGAENWGVSECGVVEASPYCLLSSSAGEAGNPARTISAGETIHGYLNIPSGSWFQLKIGAFDQTDGNRPFTGMVLYERYDYGLLQRKSATALAWSEVAMAAIPSGEWCYFEFGGDDSGATYFILQDASGSPVLSISRSGTGGPSGYLKLENDGSGASAVGISPLEKA